MQLNDLDLTDKDIVYLASPYSHPDAGMREVRANEAARAAADLINAKGCAVFSPIAHTHAIHCVSDLPTGFDFWERFDTAMLSACTKLVVLMLPGWDTSKGIEAELAIWAGLHPDHPYQAPQYLDYPCDEPQSIFSSTQTSPIEYR